LCLAGLAGTLLYLFRPVLPILFTQAQLFLMASGAQLTYPVLTLEMIDMHPQARGAAASVQTFIALGVGGMAMGLLAPVLRGDLRLLGWLSLGSGIAAWLAWRAGKGARKA
jgi:DHA1 family bicyclomycin/chloramphenicol resistance-like MFS transporter